MVAVCNLGASAASADDGEVVVDVVVVVPLVVLGVLAASLPLPCKSLTCFFSGNSRETGFPADFKQKPGNFRKTRLSDFQSVKNPQETRKNPAKKPVKFRTARKTRFLFKLPGYFEQP